MNVCVRMLLFAILVACIGGLFGAAVARLPFLGKDQGLGEELVNRGWLRLMFPCVARITAQHSQSDFRCTHC